MRTSRTGIILTSRQDHLTAAEEAELARRRDAGDVAARNLLVERNLSLVAHFARPWMRIDHRNADDYLLVGYQGLVRAADHFDPERGKFSTCAWQHLNCAFQDLYHDKRHLVRPKRTRTTACAADQERARRLKPVGWSRDEETTFLDLSAKGDRDADPAEAPRVDLSSLDNRSQLVLSLRFGLNGHPVQSLAQVGRRIGVTKQRIQQIQTKAISRLRKQMVAS